MKKMLNAAIATTMLLFAPLSHASTFYVTMDTTPLIGHPSGLFYLDFLLTDGDASVNNTVTISNFDFGGGAGGTNFPTYIGDASGTLGTSVMLGDSSAINDFYEEFDPGTTLSFQVDLTLNSPDPDNSPDNFSFSILDSSWVPIPTEDDFDAFLSVNLTEPLLISTFDSDPESDPFLLAPVIIPEPSIVMLIIAGGSLCWRASRRFATRR